MKLGDRTASLNQELVRWSERVIALALLVAVICFFIATLRMFFGVDSNSMTTLHELGQRVLLMTIALELLRALMSHELASPVNLLSFVIARRMLEPQTAFWEAPLANCMVLPRFHFWTHISVSPRSNLIRSISLTRSSSLMLTYRPEEVLRPIPSGYTLMRFWKGVLSERWHPLIFCASLQTAKQERFLCYDGEASPLEPATPRRH